MRFGFIGLGNIGAPIAERLVQAGVTVTLFDVLPGAMAPFRDLAALAASPAEVGAQSDLIGVCVRDDADARAVVSGADGLLSAMTGGAIAIHSTVRPATVVALAEAARSAGVALLDAAVTGGADGAARGALTCMAGGDAADLERLRPLLDAYCGAVVHAGGTGAGMTLKLANNLVTYVELIAALEGYRLAEAAGLDPALLDTVMTSNGNLTPAMKGWIQHRRSGPATMGEAAFRASQEALAILAEKDLALAIETGADLGLDLPVADRVRTMFRNAATRS